MNTTKRTLLVAAAASALTFTFGCRGDVDASDESRRQAEAVEAESSERTDAITGKKLDFDQNGRLHEDEAQTGTGGSGTGDCEGAEASPTGTCEGQDTLGTEKVPPRGPNDAR